MSWNESCGLCGEAWCYHDLGECDRCGENVCADCTDNVNDQRICYECHDAAQAEADAAELEEESFIVAEAFGL